MVICRLRVASFPCLQTGGGGGGREPGNGSRLSVASFPHACKQGGERAWEWVQVESSLVPMLANREGESLGMRPG